MKKEKQFACVIPNSFIYSVNKKKNDDFLNNNTAILFLIYNEATIAIQTIVSKKFWQYFLQNECFYVSWSKETQFGATLGWINDFRISHFLV